MHRHCWSNVKPLSVLFCFCCMWVWWRRRWCTFWWRDKGKALRKIWIVNCSNDGVEVSLLRVSPPRSCCFPHTQINWEERQPLIQCVERLWQETLKAALCRSHWLLLELKVFPFFFFFESCIMVFCHFGTYNKQFLQQRGSTCLCSGQRVCMKRCLPDMWLALKTRTLLTMLLLWELLCRSGNECPLLSGHSTPELPTPCKNLWNKEPTPNYTCFYF